MRSKSTKWDVDLGDAYVDGTFGTFGIEENEKCSIEELFNR